MIIKKNIRGTRYDEFFLKYFGTSKEKLTLARISPKNIYLNLFGGANFH